MQKFNARVSARNAISSLLAAVLLSQFSVPSHARDGFDSVVEKIKQKIEGPETEQEAFQKIQEILDQAKIDYANGRYLQALNSIKNNFIALDGPDSDSDTKDKPTEQIVCDFKILTADTYAKLAKFDDAEDLYDDFVTTVADKDPAFKPEYTIRALNGLADIAITQGRFADARSYLDQAIDLAKKDNLHESYTLTSKLTLGSYYWQQLRLKESEDVLTETLSEMEKSKISNKSLEAYALEILSNINLYRNNIPLAREQAEKSLKLRTELFGEESLEVASILKTLAPIEYIKDRSKANQLRLKALSTQIKILGTSNHPTVANTMLSTAGVFDSPFSARESIYLAAKHCVDGLLDSESPFMASYLARVASVNLSEQKLKPAADAIQRALELQRKLYGERSLYEAESLETLAIIKQEDQIERAFANNTNEEGVKCAVSTEAIEKAISIADERLGPDSYKSGMFLVTLSSIKSTEGDLVGSATCAQKALSILQRTLPDNDSRLNLPKKLLYRSLLKQGKKKEAQDILVNLINNRIEERGIADKELLLYLLADLQKTVTEDRVEEMESFRLKLIQKLPAEDVGLSGTMALLASHYGGAKGTPDSALRLANKVVMENERVYGDDSPRITHYLLSLAKIYKQSGRLQDAQNTYLKVKSIQEIGLGADHPQLIETLTDYYQLLREMGKEKEADAIRAQRTEIETANQRK